MTYIRTVCKLEMLISSILEPGRLEILVRLSFMKPMSLAVIDAKVLKRNDIGLARIITIAKYKIKVTQGITIKLEKRK